MNITYESVKRAVGAERVDEVSHEICQIHGGIGLHDFKVQVGGIDASGCSEADQEKIKALLLKDDATTELTSLTRAELEAKAKSVGLDGNKYTNKSELAAAILAVEGKN